MPLEPSISLQVRRPEIMSPAQAISLQNMVQQMQMGRIEQAMTLQQLARQNAITARLQQADATDPNGSFTPQALSDITRIDPAAGLKLSQLQMHIEDERQTRKFQQVQIEAAQEKLRESLRTSQKDVLNAAVSRVELTGKDASPQKKDELMRQYYQEELDRQQASGLYNYSEEQWQNLRKYPITYEEAKGRITTPKELASQRKYEERDVPLKGDMMQREYREGPTEPWKPLGAPTHKFSKQVIQIGQTPDVLSKGGLDVAAEQYLSSGQLPSLGMGSAAVKVRQDIINRAAELAKQRQVKPEDLPTERARFQASKTALASISRLGAQVLSFEGTALRNLDVAMEEARKFARTGVPIVDAAGNIIRKNLGDRDLPALQAALITVRNEYAKVSASATAAGQGGTRADREEIDKLLSSSMNLQQLERVAGIMKKDMENRRKAIEAEKSNLMKTMKVGQQAGEGDEPAIAPIGKESVQERPTFRQPPLKFEDPDKEDRYQAWKKAHGY